MSEETNNIFDEYIGKEIFAFRQQLLIPRSSGYLVVDMDYIAGENPIIKELSERYEMISYHLKGQVYTLEHCSDRLNVTFDYENELVEDTKVTLKIKEMFFG